MKVDEGFAFLNAHGLNMVAILSCKELPISINQTMSDQSVPISTYSHLVLIGNHGADFWGALQRYGMQTEEPVDHFSEVITQQFIREYLEQAPSLMLYPKPFMIPLQQLGHLAGWHHPSPLGIGIHSEFGLWFAYRSAFLTQADLPLIRHNLGGNPCDSCITKPCITACPAQAVSYGQPFNIPSCAQHRVQPHSPCADRCFARLACPVGAEQHYPIEQIQYHYQHSMASIKKYSSPSG